MAHTNKTTNYELPQFIATDKPTWLGDVNGAMLAIDTAIAGVDTTATAADGKADLATATANDAASAAADAATVANTANTNATSALTTAGNAATAASAAQTTASAVDTKVGDLTTLTTTDKTSVVGAINEVVASVPTSMDADDVTYDNTTSGLVATNVQAAIDEVVASAVTPEADDVAYDNTTSGLVATNVQDAIDELASATPAGEYVEVTADGTKNNLTLFAELYALVTNAKVTDKTTLEIADATSGDTLVYNMNVKSASKISFSRGIVNPAATKMDFARLMFGATTSDCYWSECSITTGGATFSNQNSTVPAANTALRITY